MREPQKQQCCFQSCYISDFAQRKKSLSFTSDYTEEFEDLLKELLTVALGSERENLAHQ